MEILQGHADGLELPGIEEEGCREPGDRTEEAAEIETRPVVHSKTKENKEKHLQGIVHVCGREATEALQERLSPCRQAPPRGDVLSAAVVQSGLKEVSHELRLEGAEHRTESHQGRSQAPQRRQASSEVDFHVISTS